MSSEISAPIAQPTFDLNVTQCKGDNDGDGCLKVFPNKKKPGLCATCFLVDVTHKDNPQEQQRYKEMAKCAGCGMCSKNMVGNQCGACKQLALPPGAPPATTAPRTSQGINANANFKSPTALSAGFQEKMQAAKAAQTINRENEIISLRNNRMSGGHVINAFFLFFNNLTLKPITAVGQESGTFPADMSLHDVVLNEVIGKVNSRIWEDNTGGKLEAGDYWLRFPDNTVIPVCENGSIGQAYDGNANLPCNKKQWFEGPSSGRKKSTIVDGHFILFWVMLWVKKIEKRIGRLPDEFKGVSSKGQPKEDSSTERTLVKRPGASSFRTPLNKEVQSVKLLFVTIDTDEFGDANPSWETGETKEVTLESEPFLHGASKLMMIGPQQFVAKRFAVIPEGRLPYTSLNVNQLTSTLAMDLNKEYLTAEFKVQYSGDYFLKELYREARKRQISVSDDFTFTECKLACEVVGVSQTPSKASRISTDEYLRQTTLITEEAFNDQGTPPAVVWLIEPLQAQQVTKYSGTLVQSKKKTLPFMTMAAFAHFTYCWSQEQLVYVDLQASSALSTSSVTKRILFDAMTHTEGGNGTSGPGDHGNEGIAAFKKSHYCNDLCRDLGLEPFEKDVGDDEYSDLMGDVGLGESASTGGKRRGKGHGSARRKRACQTANDSESSGDDTGQSLTFHD
ncbi:Eukaryotic elongation factor 2 kinase [Marasmius sp. AFHP31]|nr:Eukaryotic elongation factor 2 kinase [Marasmius sp. AFHP31]